VIDVSDRDAELTEFAGWLQAERPDLPVVVVCPQGSVGEAARVMTHGSTVVVEEGSDPCEVRSRIAELVDPVRRATARRGEIDDHLRRARNSIGDGRLDAAAEHVGLDPSRPEGHNLQGAVAELGGRWLDALKHYRAALAVDPAYGPADRNLERVVVRHEIALQIDLGEDGPQ
jgi:hypothetical protein